MSEITKVEGIFLEEEYKQWIKDVGNRYRAAQIKAAVSVNRLLIEFYWNLGKDIVNKQVENKWGSGFYSRLSKDLKKVIPEAQGFSVPNLRFVRRFYDLYKGAVRTQVVSESFEAREKENRSQVVSEITEQELFSVPWGHHREIITKCNGNADKAIFFVKKTIENNWSRTVLDNFLDTDLFERQGKAITNFAYSLPAKQSGLAQEMTKDPYNFNFLAINEKYDETMLKDALMNNSMKCCISPGTQKQKRRWWFIKLFMAITVYCADLHPCGWKPSCGTGRLINGLQRRSDDDCGCNKKV